MQKTSRFAQFVHVASGCRLNYELRDAGIIFVGGTGIQFENLTVIGTKVSSVGNGSEKENCYTREWEGMGIANPHTSNLQVK